jgi:uncharacterized damage-inducible protein DinB
MHEQLIERYVAGASQLRQSIAGLSPQELRAFPVPGTWSIQQIVLHMMDSDLIGADRMKRVAVEKKPPTLIGYDESAFAAGLSYHELDPQLACDVFERNRQLTAESLRRLPAEAYQRKGHHNEHGEMTLAQLLKTYVEHLEHHLKFIRQKRELLGKPL